MGRRERERDEDRQASCEGKTAFLSWDAARRVLPKHNGAVEIYRCRFCGTWHVGVRNRLP